MCGPCDQGQARAVRWWAVTAAGLCPVVLTGAWLIADALQPVSYSPVRQTISVLAGDVAVHRWIMTAALLVVALCYLVTAAGMTGARRSARLLLVLAGVCSLGIAATPEPATGPTALHLAWTGVGALTITIWPVFASLRRQDRPLPLRVPARVWTAALFTALLCWVLIEARGGSSLGMAERVSVSVQTCWPFVVAIAMYRMPAAAGRADAPAGAHRTGATRSVMSQLSAQTVLPDETASHRTHPEPADRSEAGHAVGRTGPMRRAS